MLRLRMSLFLSVISLGFTIATSSGQPLIIVARTSTSERPGFSRLGSDGSSMMAAQINDRAQVFFQATYRDPDPSVPDRPRLYRNDWSIGSNSANLTRLIQVCDPIQLIPGQPVGYITRLDDFVVSDYSSFTMRVMAGDDGECGACNSTNGIIAGQAILHGHLPIGSPPSYFSTFHGVIQMPNPEPPSCDIIYPNLPFPCSSSEILYGEVLPLAALGDYWVDAASTHFSKGTAILVGATANSNDSCLITDLSPSPIPSGPEQGNAISRILSNPIVFSLGNNAGEPWYSMALHLDVGGFGASAIWAGKIGSSLIPDDINRFRVMHGGELAPSSTLCFQNSNIYLPTVTCNSMKSVAFFSALTNCTTQNTEGHGLFMWRKNDSPRLRKLVATGDPVVYGTQTGVFTSVGSHLIPPALNALDEVVFIGSINTCSSGQCDVYGLFRVYIDSNNMVQVEVLALEGERLFADTGPVLVYIRPSATSGPVTNDAGDVLFTAVVQQDSPPSEYEVVARFNNRCRRTPVGNSFRALARTGQFLPVLGGNITICHLSLAGTTLPLSSGSDGRPAIMNPNGQSVFLAQVSDVNQSCSSTQAFLAYIFDPSLSYCPADMDGDCGVDINDYLLFLGWYSEGDERSDLDDGSGTGVRDGGITIDDYIYFAYYFENGC